MARIHGRSGGFAVRDVNWTVSLGMTYGRDRGLFAEMDTTLRPQTKANIDNRSDVFAFGATLYEALTGRAIFKRETNADTLAAILRDDPVPASSLNPEVSVELQWVLEKALAKEPRDRYQTREIWWSTSNACVGGKSVRLSVSSQGESASGTPDRRAGRRPRTVPRTPAGSSPPAVISESPAPVGSAAPAPQSTPVVIPPPTQTTHRPVDRRGVGGRSGHRIARLAPVRYRAPSPPPSPPASLFYYQQGHYLREKARHCAVSTTPSTCSPLLGGRFELRQRLGGSERGVLDALRDHPGQASSGEAEGRLGALAMAPDRPRFVAQAELLVSAATPTRRRCCCEPLQSTGISTCVVNLGWAYQAANYAKAAFVGRSSSTAELPVTVSLGNFYRITREREAAIESYRRALELKPNSVSALTTWEASCC
jgi:hypothetical protein